MAGLSTGCLIVFNVNFNDEICHINNNIQDIGCLSSTIKYENYSHIYNDTIDDRNNFLYKANQKLKELCIYNNYIFCDLWDILWDKNTNKLKQIYLSNKPNDHHIIPNASLTTSLTSAIALDSLLNSALSRFFL